MKYITPLAVRSRAVFARYATRRTAVAALIILAFLVFAGIKVVTKDTDASNTDATPRQVRVAPAGSASQTTSILETTGEVKSEVQGDLRAQTAGVITRVNARIGQRVGAGTIIASIENASQRASVAQAQAGVAQAQANLNKIKGGTRDEQLAILAANTASAAQALAETRASARNTLLSAYTTTDTTFKGGVDVMFNNPSGADPRLVFNSTNNAQLVTAEHARLLAQITIARHAIAAPRVNLLDAPALTNEINLVEQEMRKIKVALDNLIGALDGSVPNATVSGASLESYKTVATSARASVLAALTSISNTRGAINSAQSALVIAQENEGQGVAGAQREDIEVAEAQVASARASLAQTAAQLEKTYIRAPVTGVVTLLNVEVGDFVTSFQDVGLIANDGTLEVQTFVSATVVDRLSVGARVLIDKLYPGTITSIAPGIDPTKRQVEVRVAFDSGATAVAHGSRVAVEFLGAADAMPTDPQLSTGPIMLPIAALKFVGNDAFVFVVNTENVLEQKRVELGEIVQASVVVKSGITADTVIVLDARGLNAGDTVVVVTQ